jgi:hypothetical protein
MTPRHLVQFREGAAQEAAAAIIALINSSPRSPRQDEIEAIISRVAVSPGPIPASAKATEWRRAVADLRQGFELRGEEYKRWKAAGREPTNDDLDRVADIDTLSDRVDSATHAIWAAGATCWADIALFAELARYWVWDPEDPDLDRCFKAELDPHDTGFDEQAAAQLVNAVLQLAGAPP